MCVRVFIQTCFSFSVQSCRSFVMRLVNNYKCKSKDLKVKASSEVELKLSGSNKNIISYLFQAFFRAMCGNYVLIIILEKSDLKIFRQLLIALFWQLSFETSLPVSQHLTGALWFCTNILSHTQTAYRHCFFMYILLHMLGHVYLASASESTHSVSRVRKL